jgi:hypothetical protein
MRLLLTLTLVAVVAFYLGYHDTRYNSTGGLITAWSPWNLYPMVLIHLVGLALSPALFFAFLPSLKRQHWLYLVSIAVMMVMGMLLFDCCNSSWLWPDLAALNPCPGCLWCEEHSYQLWHATDPFAWDNLKGEALRHLQVSAACYLTALALLYWKGRAEVQQVKEAEAEAERLLLRGDTKETTV